ncbi:hypothetical protein HGRIS_002917 [Hohenbuehelia grisea]|uniref:Uncharacterized protein n=1 Tax=Hohenbuehelia grisea TaxID=104357 RepID=A0ABR3JNB6_9AGAR
MVFNIVNEQHGLLCAVLDCLTVRELIRYSNVSRMCRQGYSSYCQTAFAPQNVLKDYFTPVEIDSFRRLQLQTGMVISGSTALALASCAENFANSDLDLYAEGESVAEVAEWLASAGFVRKALMGYNRPDMLLSPADVPAGENGWAISDKRFGGGPHGAYSPGVLAVNEYVRERPDGKGSARVQLIACMHTVGATILNFHSTAVMNIVSAHAIYCLYPESTFINKMSYMRVQREGEKDQIAKYESRGFTAEPMVSPFPLSGELVPGKQCLADSFTWVIPLAHPDVAENDSHIARLSDPIRGTSWTLHWTPDFLELRFHIIKACMLKCGLTVADTTSWHRVLDSSLQEVWNCLTFEGLDMKHVRASARYSKVFLYCLQYMDGLLEANVQRERELLEYIWQDGVRYPVGNIIDAADIWRQVPAVMRDLRSFAFMMVRTLNSRDEDYGMSFNVRSNLPLERQNAMEKQFAERWEALTRGANYVDEVYQEMPCRKYTLNRSHTAVLIIRTMRVREIVDAEFYILLSVHYHYT